MDVVIKSIIDALFAELEKTFANKPIILIIVHILHQTALSLIPTLVAKMEPTVVAQVK